MERRLALATAGAVAATLGIGTVCFAALGGGNLLGLSGDGGAAKIVPAGAVEQVTKVVVVHSADTTIVVAPTGTDGTSPAAPASPVAVSAPVVPVVGTAAPTPTTAPAAAPDPTVASTTKPTTATTAKPTATTVKPVTTTSAAPATTAPPSTAAPTTVKPVTSTTSRPRGVPADWPAGKPIPPMPPGCQDPQLELNGVWNCDD